MAPLNVLKVQELWLDCMVRKDSYVALECPSDPDESVRWHCFKPCVNRSTSQVPVSRLPPFSLGPRGVYLLTPTTILRNRHTDASILSGGEIEASLPLEKPAVR